MWKPIGNWCTRFIHSFIHSVSQWTSTEHHLQMCMMAQERGSKGMEQHITLFLCFPCINVLLKCRFWCSRSGVPRLCIFSQQLPLTLMLLVLRPVSLCAPVINWELDAMLIDACVLHPGSPTQTILMGNRDWGPLLYILPSQSSRTGGDTQAKDATESDRGTKAGFLIQPGLSEWGGLRRDLAKRVPSEWSEVSLLDIRYRSR